MGDNVEAYDKLWDLAQHRFTSHQYVSKYLQEHKSTIGLEKAKSLLSLGSGNGVLDENIIQTCMPHLETYIAVDPCTNLLHQAQEIFHNVSRVKAHFTNSKMQDYSHPPNSVDIILVLHSFYYVTEVKEQISKFLQWLSKDGVIVIAVDCIADKDHPNFTPAFRTEFNITSFCPECDSITNKIPDALRDLKIPYKDDFLPNDILFHPGEGLKELVHIQLGRQPTQDEVERSVKLMQKYSSPGSYRCPIGQKIFVIHKC